MPFSRVIAPTAKAEIDSLTSDMVGIGMNFAARANPQPNIEDTLLYASVEAVEKPDLRVLAVLTTWFGLYATWVNVDRLTQLVTNQESQRVRAFWSALAYWWQKDPRYARLCRLYSGPRQDLLSTGTSFHIMRHGEDRRFAGSALRVPGNVLRDRSTDVLRPAELARRHHAFRYRVMIGPGYRADMWAAIELDPTLSAAELARKTYGSFATAWRVKRDLAIFRPSLRRPAKAGKGKL